MGAKVIIFDKILKSSFLKGLRHSALPERQMQKEKPQEDRRASNKKWWPRGLVDFQFEFNIYIYIYICTKTATFSTTNLYLQKIALALLSI